MEIFEKMSDGDLIDIYELYQYWNRTGVIPDNTILSEIRNKYAEKYGHSAILLIERDYLRECTKRFCEKYISTFA